MKNIQYAVKWITVLFISFVLANSGFAQPVITSFTPASGPVGTTVTITGNNFNTNPANNIVYFGAVRANVSAATTTTLTVTVPAGATYQPITVATNNLIAASSQPFLVTFSGGGAAINPASFAYRIDTVTGTSPSFSTIADFDGDGKPDIAVTNAKSNTFSIFKNTSPTDAISFLPIVDFPTSTNPQCVMSADFDGDGKPDVAVVNATSNSVTIYKNTSTASAISFAIKSDFAVGKTPVIMAIGDLDKDGRLDIAVVNADDNSVSILRNTTTGTNISFAAKLDYATGTNPESLFIADLNLDGQPDVVVANYNSSTLSIFKNTSAQGNISFAAKTDYPTGTNPMSVSVADFNGDGTPDIATANYTSSTVSILKNTVAAGQITLDAKVDYRVGGNPYCLYADDLDGDGKIDIATSNYASNNVSILKNATTSGSISFAIEVDFSVGKNPFNVVSGDLDLDGKPDLVTANYGANTLTVLKNTGGSNLYISSFTPSKAGTGTQVNIYGTGFTGVTSVTLGGVPATIVSVSSTMITVLVGAGATGNVTVTTPFGTVSVPGFTYIPSPTITSFTPTTAATGSTITITGTNFTNATAVSFGGVAATSFIVVSPTVITAVVGNGASGNVSVTTPGGTATLTGFVYLSPPSITSFTPNNATIGSTVTITGTNFTGATAVTFGESPATSFTVVSPTTITAVVGAVTGGSVNVTTPGGTARAGGFYNGLSINSFSPTTGVGGTTVTITGNNFNPSPGNNIVYFGATRASVIAATTTSLTVRVPQGSTYRPISVTTDKLTAYTAKPFTVTLQNPLAIDTTSYSSKTDLSNGLYNPYHVTVADFDGDGKPDIVTPNAASNTVSVFRNISNNSVIAFDAKVEFSIGAQTPLISTADVDGDGKIDIVATTSMGDRIVVLKNLSTSGFIAFSTPVEQIFGSGYSSDFTIGDADGDGKPDLIVIGGAGANQVTVFRNASINGTISFIQQSSYPTSMQPQSIAFGDFDGDSKPDLAISNFNYNKITVYKNTSSTGLISFLSQPDIVMPNALGNISAADFDGDGKLDIAVANHLYNNISILKNISNNGSFAFANPIDLATGDNPYNFSIGDVDDDGKPDIAFANILSNTVSVVKNISSGTNIAFATKVDYATERGPTSVEICDFDLDNKPDLAASVFNANKITIFSNSHSIVTGLPNISFGSSGYKVYPNPTNRFLHISSSNTLKKTSVSITDLNGRVVLLDKIFTGSSTTLDLSSYANGPYIITLTDLISKIKTETIIEKY